MNKPLLVVGGIVNAIAISAISIFGTKGGILPTSAALDDQLPQSQFDGLYSVTFRADQPFPNNDDYHFNIVEIDNDDCLILADTGRGSTLFLSLVDPAAGLDNKNPEYITLGPYDYIWNDDANNDSSNNQYTISNPKKVMVEFANEDDVTMLEYSNDSVNGTEAIGHREIVDLDAEDIGGTVFWIKNYGETEIQIAAITVWYPVESCTYGA